MPGRPPGRRRVRRVWRAGSAAAAAGGGGWGGGARARPPVNDRVAAAPWGVGAPLATRRGSGGRRARAGSVPAPRVGALRGAAPVGAPRRAADGASGDTAVCGGVGVGAGGGV